MSCIRFDKEVISRPQSFYLNLEAVFLLFSFCPEYALAFIYLFILLCRATPKAYGNSQVGGSNLSYSCQSVPQSQQCQI